MKLFWIAFLNSSEKQQSAWTSKEISKLLTIKYIPKIQVPVARPGWYSCHARLWRCLYLFGFTKTTKKQLNCLVMCVTGESPSAIWNHLAIAKLTKDYIIHSIIVLKCVTHLKCECGIFHGIVDIWIFKSHSTNLWSTARLISIPTHCRVALPRVTERYTILKSPHIYKKHRVQYEIRTHRLLVQVGRKKN